MSRIQFKVIKWVLFPLTEKEGWWRQRPGDNRIDFKEVQIEGDSNNYNT